MSNAKSVLLVKKAEAKKGKLWNDLTNERIIKQHGGFDIPDDDLHAIHKYVSPLNAPQSNPEETKETLTELEKEIQHLKEKEQTTTPSLPPQDFEEYFDDDDEQR